MGDHSLTTRIDDDRLEDAPPAARLVYLALREDGAATRNELAGRLGVGYSTVQFATDWLDDAGVVARKPCPAAPSTSTYRVCDTGGELQ